LRRLAELEQRSIELDVEGVTCKNSGIQVSKRGKSEKLLGGNNLYLAFP
jgi:hypothetical protein